MTRVAIRTVSSVAVLLATSALALAEDVRTGKAAYGDWQTDAPGVMRKITVNDLAAPLETPPSANMFTGRRQARRGVACDHARLHGRAVCDRHEQRARDPRRPERRHLRCAQQ